MGRQTDLAPPVIPGLHYVRSLGSGGFADILLYEQDFPRRRVAVKVMHTAVNDPTQVALFEREADALAAVSAHPSILSIFSASISADGRPYLVLEYCPDSLQSSFRTHPMDVARALDLGVRVASALESCHRSGILHRDIKPSNLLINEFGNVVLADFGIVGSVDPTDAEEYFALSVPWSAPEVVDELSSGSVASEVWSLSATLYALLAGRGPFERPGPGQNNDDKISGRIRKAKYTPVGRMDVPPQLEHVLEQGMSKNPAKRQESAISFAQQLRAVQQYLGLAPTDLEIAEAPAQYLLPEQVTFGAAPGDSLPPSPHVNFGARSRGPIRSKVEVDSKRRRIQEQRRPHTISSSRGSRTTSSGIPQPEARGLSVGAVVGIVAAVAAVTAIVVVVLMTWMGG